MLGTRAAILSTCAAVSRKPAGGTVCELTSTGDPGAGGGLVVAVAVDAVVVAAVVVAAIPGDGAASASSPAASSVAPQGRARPGSSKASARGRSAACLGDRDCLGEHLLHPRARDERDQDHVCEPERDQRDREEPQALMHRVLVLGVERPVPVPPEV